MHKEDDQMSLNIELLRKHIHDWKKKLAEDPQQRAAQDNQQRAERAAYYQSQTPEKIRAMIVS